MKFLLALIIVIFTVYFPSFYGVWQLDDFHTIINNESIHIGNFSFSALSNIRLSRYIAYFTFGLNYYFGGINIFGYHVLNLIIHLITSFVIYLILVELLSLKIKNHNKIVQISIWTTLLWALSPIQVQAVTYIVQRMASLSALFYFLSFLLYLYARNYSFQLHKEGRIKLIVFYFFSAIFFLLALFSKINTIMLPVIILLFEYLFYKKADNKWLLKKIIPIFLSIIIISLFYFNGNILNNPIIKQLTSNSFKLYPFSPTDKLLIEPSILIMYLGLMIFPFVGNFRLLYDYDFLNMPYQISTYIAIVIILSLIFYAYKTRKKNPLVTFAILFYFINHIVESSFLEIDLVFEHRNYLPSFTFFLIIVILIFKIKSDKIQYLVLLGLTLFSMLNTFMLNLKYEEQYCNAIYDYKKEYKAQNELIANIAAKKIMTRNNIRLSKEIREISFHNKVNNTNLNKNLKDILIFITYDYKNYLQDRVIFEKNINPSMAILKNNLLRNNELIAINHDYKHFIIRMYLDFLETKYIKIPRQQIDRKEVVLFNSDAFNEKIQKKYKRDVNILYLKNKQIIQDITLSFKLTETEKRILEIYLTENSVL